MTQNRRIAVDVMGGDFGPSITVPAALDVMSRHPRLELVLAGDASKIEPLLEANKADRQRIEVLHCKQTISSDDKPEGILRSGRGSSMFLAIEQVQKQLAGACVSAGNTGALLLAGRHLLKTIPGIEKPAIMATIPVTRSGGYSYLLDVGANLHNTHTELFGFARMGALVATSLSGRSPCRVALLNNGEESSKGTAVIQDAARLLSACQDFEYIGFIEGNQIFSGRADVIVCDGFTGNITIKVSAGAVTAMKRQIQRSISKHWYYRMFSWILSPLFSGLRKEVEPTRYNGATLIGLQGIVVKSHGHADRTGFSRAIEHAIKQINDNVPALIASRMAADPVSH
ncbi:MAG: phosphate acyltransferase PlsX [Pseudohongiella nitratireducens]|nr:phosphate acyltransferase PlsX [Pseudohongiella nitratireducens]MDF1623906.1 phosphate acyltransferase PlsX [Pseudohongiella nitratireducens]